MKKILLTILILLIIVIQTQTPVCFGNGITENRTIIAWEDEKTKSEKEEEINPQRTADTNDDVKKAGDFKKKLKAIDNKFADREKKRKEEEKDKKEAEDDRIKDEKKQEAELERRLKEIDAKFR